MKAATTPTRRYRAFLSYASADRKTSKWLQQAIEAYHIPRTLRPRVGGATRIRPIFRDREELPAGGHLPEHLSEALAGADYLIVLCTSASAASEWVNREILTFKSLNAAANIIPVIGPNVEEGDPSAVFPPGLGQMPDGSLDPVKPMERLGADLRKSGDGRREGLLKVVSGLLGVGFNAVRQREREAARRRAAFAWSLAGLFAVLSVVAAAALVWALNTNNKLETAFLGVMSKLSEQTEAIITLSDENRITVETADRELGAAQDLFELAYRLAPRGEMLDRREADLRLLLATSALKRGRYEEALKALERGMGLVKERLPPDPETGEGGAEDLHQYLTGLTMRGIAQDALGRTEDARISFEHSLAYAQILTKRNPDSWLYMQDVAVVQENLAALDMQQDELDSARTRLTSSLEIFDRLQSLSRDAVGQHSYAYMSDVSRVQVVLAELSMREGDAARAQDHINRAQAGWLTLLLIDPADKTTIEGLAMLGEQVVEVYSYAGQMDQALESMIQTVNRRQFLSEQDIGNTYYREALVRVVARAAELRKQRGETERACEVYQSATHLARGLIDYDDSNPDYWDHARTIEADRNEVCGWDIEPWYDAQDGPKMRSSR